MKAIDNVVFFPLQSGPPDISRRPSTSKSHPRKITTPSTTKNLTQSDRKSSETDAYATFIKDEREILTPYEKFVYDSENDPRFKEEESANRRIGFYRITRNIGHGSFSLVKLGQHVLTREKVAIKVLNKKKIDERTQKLLLNEITFMKDLYHPNVIRLYEVLENPQDIFIVTEYAAYGDLYTRIDKNGKMDENEAKHIFVQLVAAVNYIHSKNIVHRDIKSENVIFANEKLIKLCDFGFSTYAERNEKLNLFCGSPPYAAPELYRDDYYIGTYVDLWAMGVVLYFMLTGLMPFRADNTDKLKKAIIDGHYSIPAHVPIQCQEIIRGLLQDDINQRWTMNSIRSCLWLSNENFLKGFDQLPFNIKHYKEYIIEKKSPVSIPSIEYAAYNELKEKGIYYEHILGMKTDKDGELLSIRDNINGIYRIILHCLQKQSTALERDESLDKKTVRAGSFIQDRDRRKSVGHPIPIPIPNPQPQPANSKACIIL